MPWGIGQPGLGLGGVGAPATGSTIEEAIYWILTNDATVVSLVSTRIYPNEIPQGKSMPAVSVQQISGVRDHSLDGPSGLVEARFQVNCWEDDYVGARTLAHAARLALNNYSGTVGTCVIQCIQMVNEIDTPVILPGADVLKRFGKSLDFIIWFDEVTS